MRSKSLRFVLASVAWPMLLAFGTASAGQYSWELSGTRLQTDLPYLASASATSTGIAATHYFTPVDDSLGPYVYAAFLNRSSRITGSISHTAIDRTVGTIPPTVRFTVTDRTDSYSVAGRNVWRGSGWYVGGGAQYAHISPGLTPAGSETVNSYSAVGGKFLGRSTALDLTLASSGAWGDLRQLLCGAPPCIVPPYGLKPSTHDIGVRIRHLGRLAAMHYAVTGRVTAIHTELRFQGALLASERLRTYAISGELFPSARLGIRLDYATLDHDFGHHGAYALSASWFFKRDVAVRFSWSPANYPGYSGNDDGAQLSVLGRF